MTKQVTEPVKIQDCDHPVISGGCWRRDDLRSSSCAMFVIFSYHSESYLRSSRHILLLCPAHLSPVVPSVAGPSVSPASLLPPISPSPHSPVSPPSLPPPLPASGVRCAAAAGRVAVYSSLTTPHLSAKVSVLKLAK